MPKHKHELTFVSTVSTHTVSLSFCFPVSLKLFPLCNACYDGRKRLHRIRWTFGNRRSWSKNTFLLEQCKTLAKRQDFVGPLRISSELVEDPLAPAPSNDVGEQRPSRAANALRNAVESEEQNIHIQIQRRGRQRRVIDAGILIDADVEEVWQVLTDYERLPDFIPNLCKCERLPREDGGVRLLQVGSESLAYIHFEAKVVLDLEEDKPHGLTFTQVDGDFHMFRGRWQLSAVVLNGEDGDEAKRRTLVEYHVEVKPKLMIPYTFLAKIVRRDLPLNLLAIRQRAERISLGLPALSASMQNSSLLREAAAMFPAVGEPGACLIVEEDPEEWMDGDASVTTVRRSNTWFRRIRAAFFVDRPLKRCWQVLTDYEHLREFVPNLAHCERLPHPEGKIRLLQVGVKFHMYFQFQARAVLDVEEKPFEEVRFHMVDGDFEYFRGKWSLEPATGNASTCTRIQYTLDVRPKGKVPMAVVEKLIRNDLFVSLAALKQHMEDERQQQHDPEDEAAPNALAASKKKYWTDFANVERELMEYIRAHGQPGVMPKYRTMREQGYLPLVKAIGAHGGFGSVAARLGLDMSYRPSKPWGYWDKLENLERELAAFIQEHGQPGHMPTRDMLRKNGRWDIARATDKYGGMIQVAHLLGLDISRSKRSRADEYDPSPDEPCSDDADEDLGAA